MLVGTLAVRRLLELNHKPVGFDLVLQPHLVEDHHRVLRPDAERLGHH